MDDAQNKTQTMLAPGEAYKALHEVLSAWVRVGAERPNSGANAAANVEEALDIVANVQNRHGATPGQLQTLERIADRTRELLS